MWSAVSGTCVQAAVFGHVQVVQVLLECRANPNARTQSGSTPLYFAGQNGHSDLLRCLGATVTPHLTVAVV